MIIRYSSYCHHFLTRQLRSEVLCRTHFYCILDKTLWIHLFSYIIYFMHVQKVFSTCCFWIFETVPFVFIKVHYSIFHDSYRTLMTVNDVYTKTLKCIFDSF